MIEINNIYNNDCIDFMNEMSDDKFKVDLILTSPPYNTSRTTGTLENHEKRYDFYLENKDNEEYDKWTLNLFNHFDKILNANGCVIYNISYGDENPSQMFTCISKILSESNFVLADVIGWKKHTALPNNVSSNKLTRIFEFVFIFCRKEEFYTFHCNKKVISTSSTGQKIYENIYNLIEAKNNDESTNLNKATFSTEFVCKLLNIYGKENGIVYDPFMGTGTTAIACKKYGLNFLGTELSKEQCDYAINRLNKTPFPLIKHKFSKI